MKNTFKYYSAIWSVLFILFHVIAFVSVGWVGQEKYTASFWIGYVFITLTFIGQIICSYFALKDRDLKKMFYNISLFTTSYTGLILSFVFGGLCMILSAVPYWASAILCAVLLASNIIAVVKATAAIELVSAVDEKIKNQTFFIKSLTADAESLMRQAKSDEAKAACKRVYEAIRYSDPMTNDELALLERKIVVATEKLSAAVAENTDAIGDIVDELTILLADRNAKCKLLKRGE